MNSARQKLLRRWHLRLYAFQGLGIGMTADTKSSSLQSGTQCPTQSAWSVVAGRQDMPPPIQSKELLSYSDGRAVPPLILDMRIPVRSCRQDKTMQPKPWVGLRAVRHR